MSDRAYWLQTMLRIARPVLEALHHRELKIKMPSMNGSGEVRSDFAYLEALGRTLAEIASWLETGSRDGEEGVLREQCAAWARSAIDAGTDPASPDYMNFKEGFQPIVDAAFLAHAIMRAPTELWGKLDQRVKSNIIAALKQTRTRKPFFMNWLLFSAVIETALFSIGESDWDSMRVDYAIRQHEQWYLGDGIYGDGPQFHWDYYNSYVIQPMLLEIVDRVGDKYEDWEKLRSTIHHRARRYAEVQERLISPEGTFPAIGRSLAYRFGAFQHLAMSALRNELPQAISPSQVRSALTAVIRNMIEMPGTFTDDGWLTIGFCGHQPDIGESYISTGSLYLCTTVFLPLGLPAEHPFWLDPATDWTSRKAWSGLPFSVDRAVAEFHSG
ncbi:DUF2264 domain-containing protein [Cohnella silvisoli]|uniref:DUF2264 domain-containing protein n=1 Tax=Cohnella silvisoli TaxID=2873699 RepID=A0ABV1KNL6_9BACL|nr:DUF2264 domain-containing protein [Cohnella silvisoli]MCD9021042.1 DUF2264 domain-containing protein [Cohnella silvisoli]